ncbi:MAG: hypothetical protein ACJA2M_000406 [Polaribacter sp.]|jgi:hypothetical protein
MRILSFLFLVFCLSCKNSKQFKLQNADIERADFTIISDNYFMTNIDSIKMNQKSYKESITKEVLGELLFNEIFKNEYYSLNPNISDVPKHKYYYEPDHLIFMSENESFSKHLRRDYKIPSKGHFTAGSNFWFFDQSGVYSEIKDCFIDDFNYTINLDKDNYIIEFSFNSIYFLDILDFNCYCTDTTYRGGRVYIPESINKIFIEIMPFGLNRRELLDTTFRRWDKSVEVCENPKPHFMIRHLSPELNRFYPSLLYFYSNINKELNTDNTELWEKYLEIILQPYLNDIKTIDFYKVEGQNMQFELSFLNEKYTTRLTVNLNKPYQVNFIDKIPYEYSVFNGINKYRQKPKFNYGLDLRLKKELDISPILIY